jgi:hypothetical protein
MEADIGKAPIKDVHSGPSCKWEIQNCRWSPILTGSCLYQL